MSAAELDQQTMEPIIELSAAPSLGVLIGAGASLGAGLPSWDALSEHLLTASGAISNADAAREFLKAQDPQLAAEAAKISATDWNSLLQNALYGREREEPTPAPLHLAVAALAVGRRNLNSGPTGLFTLNFDQLLEAAHRVVDPIAEVFSRSKAMPRAPHGHVEVHHLHGVVPAAGTPENVVLTLSDFTALSAVPTPWQVSALQEQLHHGPLILAGTSYRDPDIRQWLHNISMNGESSAVIVLISRASLGLGREQFCVTRDALVKQWESIGVKAVVTQDHADAAQALQELLWVAQHPEEQYKPPNARARVIWDAHVDRFAELQVDYAAQLADDVPKLGELGPDANLTLWLADGVGRLARWTSYDRTYRSPDHLLRIEPGFDSRWIAGQTLGFDELTAVPLSSAPTRRWRSVVAIPVMVDAPHGPPFAAAALSSATPIDLDELDAGQQEAWHAAMEMLSLEWAERLRMRAD